MDQSMIWLDAQTEMSRVHGALSAYAEANGITDWHADDFYALKFKFEANFAAGDSLDSVNCCTRADYNHRRGLVTLYGRGIAATGATSQSIAETLIHEFRHSLPDNRAMITPQSQALPYNQRPFEIDAKNFARDVMEYYRR